MDLLLLASFPQFPPLASGGGTEEEATALNTLHMIINRDTLCGIELISEISDGIQLFAPGDLSNV